MHRRDMLTLLGMGLPLSATQMGAPKNLRIHSTDPEPLPSSALSVDVQIDGQAAVRLTDAEAVDSGSFAGATLTQRCLRATHPSLRNYTVYFRPDADGRREEIVFEYGGLLASQIAGGAGAVVTMPPHTVTIRRNGSLVATIRPTTRVGNSTVEGHGWNQRWRWQSAVRPVIRTRQELTTMGLLLPYDWSMAKVQDQTDHVEFNNQTPLAAGDMASNKGLQRYMGSVAERPDIGAITAWLASYLASSRITEETVRAQADVAAGTIPWIWRDRAGRGAPLSVYDYPNITGHHNERSDVANFVQQVGSTVSDTSSYSWIVDTAHQPAALAVMYALTEDPYYLEGLQFQIAWNFAWTRNRRWLTVDGRQYGPWQDAELRGHAYSLRTLTDAWLLSPSSTPSWLHPKSHYLQLLNDTAAVYEKKTIYLPQQPGTADQKQVWQHAFHPSVMNDGSFWQQALLSVFSARCASLGLPGWQALAEWYFEFTYATCGGQSGWDRRYPVNYRRFLGYSELKNLGNLAAQAASTNWGDFYRAQGLPAPVDGNIQIDPTSGHPRRDWYYYSFAASACAMALRIGVTKGGGVSAAYAWLTSQAATLPDGFVPRKWAVGQP